MLTVSPIPSSRRTAAERNSAMANTQKTAIVTGASQGIGAGLVDAFLKRGYNVVANSAKHRQNKPVSGVADISRWSVETSATRKRPQRSRRRPYPGSAVSMCWSTTRVSSSRSPYHRVHVRRIQHVGFHDARGLSLRFPAIGQANVAAERRQHRQRINHPR